MAQPTPSTWTLRLKSSRTTVLLHIDPLTPFSAIKASLLTALRETGFTTSSAGAATTLPSTPSAIQLGRPQDPLDPKSGFVLGEWEEDNDEDVAIDEGKNSKGKGKKGSGRDCAKGAGLKDGAVLAFRWEGLEGAEEQGWGVEIASFEDAYGVLNEGDVGERTEFEG
ncbi:hypothetical protein E8E11_010909 [Didymella keratinophila]|nr:hypothetical protein E8E11_010909 [Didymella keratinophila]